MKYSEMFSTFVFALLLTVKSVQASAITISCHDVLTGKENRVLHSPLSGSSSAFRNLPEDIIDPTLRAFESQLGIGVSDPVRGEWLSHWSIDAVRYLRLIGIPEKQITQKVTERLELYLRHGRSQGLSQPIALPKFLSGPPSPKANLLSGGFKEKYNLAGIKAKLDLLGEVYRQGGDSYSISTDYAFSLALEVNNQTLATEIFVHMLRLRDYERATKAVEKIPDSDNYLYNIGLFAITDFYNGSGHLNRIWDAIEALKRVQGPMKPQAEELLTDLAKELVSSEMLAKLTKPQRGQPNLSADEIMEVKIQSAEYALRALRVTGRLVGKVAIDSVKVDFLTEVSEPQRIQLIQQIVDFIYAQTKRGFGGDGDQLLLALTAIKDTARLNRMALDKIGLIDRTESIGRSYIFDAAFDYFFAAGNRDQALAVLQTQASDLANTNLSDIRFYMLKNAAKIGALGIVKKINLYAQSLVSGTLALRNEDRKTEAARQLIEDSNAVLNGTYLEPLDKSIPISKVQGSAARIHEDMAVQREAVIKAEIAQFRLKLTPARQKELVLNGIELMNRKQFFRAYRLFAEALYRPGLIQVANLMTNNGDGLNAVTSLLYATFLLPIESEKVLSIEMSKLLQLQF